MEFLYKFFVFYIPLLFSLCVHEWSHAYIAKKKGDLYAEQEGRLTLNPLVHIDIVGSVLLPLLSIFTGLPVFGWAKPVPVQESSLKNPRVDMFWIALAGPLSNIFMALSASGVAAVFYFLPFFSFSLELIKMSEVFIYINLLLGFFNLIPLHPLDGGKILARFLPPRWNIFLEERQAYSGIILIVVFIAGGFQYLAFPALWLSQILTYWPELVF